MKSNFSNELTLLTARLLMCESKREIVNISNEFGALIEKAIELEEKTYLPNTEKPRSITATIKFTKQEVASMAETFKKEFIANGLVARIIKRESGKVRKKTFVYEIRYRRNGYNITASSSDLSKAKSLFLEMTSPKNITQYYHPQKSIGSGARLFSQIATEWLATKDGDIDPRTFRDYKMNLETRILPKLEDRRIADVRSSDIKEILNAEQGRVVETLQIIFNGIMFYAISNGDILHNPMKAIKFKKVARKKRRALTEEEQRTFLTRIELPEFAHYRRLLLIEYYFGLRPWELTDAHFEGDFLIALNAKHKDGAEKVYKKIPVPKQAREKLNVSDAVVCNHRTEVLNRVFKRVMQSDTVTQYFLRHTFATVCSQYVRPDIVDVWMGDSSERLVGRVYTHFPDSFMAEQMDNVVFPEWIL